MPGGYLGGREERVPIGRLGMYAVLDDAIPPSVVVGSLPEMGNQRVLGTNHRPRKWDRSGGNQVSGKWRARWRLSCEDDRLTWSAGSAFRVGSNGADSAGEG